MKYVLVIGDGMADNPLLELDGETPLKYANTPAMDSLASAGVLGNVLTVPKGMQAGSDTAILSIFGCEPSTFYGGRAALEAAASGIKLEPGDIAYRCNMVTLESGDIPFEDKKILSHSAGAIAGDVADTLITDLFNTPVFKKTADEAGISIFPGNSFRHIAVQRSFARQRNVAVPQNVALPQLVLTPPHDHIGETLGQHLPRGSKNAQTLANLMRMANELLENGKTPANGIWFWAHGVATELPNFEKKYGKSGSVISAVPLCQGIGVLMGLEKIIVEGATGELHTNYEGKVKAALESLKTNDFTTIHIEAPDECTHNGDLKGKLQAIEWIDSRIVAPVKNNLESQNIDYKLLIISDHKTLLSTKGHCGDPVPYVIYDSSEDKKTDFQYCEKDAEKGLFIETGTKLLEMLFK